MATDPKIVKQISEDLENLNDIIDDIAVSLQGKLNASLSDTKDRLEDITEEFNKGKDILFIIIRKKYFNCEIKFIM